MNAITRRWEHFQEKRLTNLILPDTLVGPERVHNLYVLAKRIEEEIIPGDVIECGVCNGGTAALLARFATRSKLNRTVWLLDSFEGMPLTTSEDGEAAKAHIGKEVGNIERVKRALRRVGADMNIRRSAYDAVCSFQVLEHVTRPGNFVAASCSLLRSGGRLMLGLPNAASFLRHQHNILDMPPHHMTRWTGEVLSHIQERFPLKLMRIAYEPLADYHVEGYVDAYMGLFASRGLRILNAPSIRSRFVTLIRKTRLHKFIRGQSIYACYVRT